MGGGPLCIPAIQSLSMRIKKKKKLILSLQLEKN